MDVELEDSFGRVQKEQIGLWDVGEEMEDTCQLGNSCGVAVLAVSGASDFETEQDWLRSEIFLMNFVRGTGDREEEQGCKGYEHLLKDRKD